MPNKPAKWSAIFRMLGSRRVPQHYLRIGAVSDHTPFCDCKTVLAALRAERTMRLAAAFAEFRRARGRMNRVVNRHYSGFSDNLLRVFVFSQCHELSVSELVCSGPLGEVDPNDRFRLQPYASFHFLGGEPLTPSAF
jgi:hypothetical protein